jgi:hypothetical protein
MRPDMSICMGGIVWMPAHLRYSHVIVFLDCLSSHQRTPALVYDVRGTEQTEKRALKQVRSIFITSDVTSIISCIARDGYGPRP